MEQIKSLVTDYPDGWNQLMSFILSDLAIPEKLVGHAGNCSYSSLFATMKQIQAERISEA